MGAAQFKNRQCKNLSGVTHTTLRFKTYIQQICGKARAKLKAFARIAPSINIAKKNIFSI